jgi:pimeloyl-ACP methyl ester carboxylesterase
VHSDSGEEQPEYGFMLECQDHLESQGINLDLYDSLTHAADLADLITALGYEEANIYGTSYGTRLGLTFMRYFPHKTRSAILDSVLPPQINFPRDGITSYLEALDNLFEACANQENCNQNYPNLEKSFNQVIQDLRANPVPLTINGEEVLLDHILFLDVIYLYLHEASVLPRIPQAIHDASQGEFGWTAQAIRGLRTYSDFVTTGVQYSAMCRDEVIFDDPESSQNLLENYDEEWQDYFNLTFYYLTCQSWVTKHPDPVENSPVASDLPALVLSGHFDPITAPSWSRDTASYLENSFYFEFPNLAHGVLRSDSCALSLGLAFLDDPSTEPDASCLDLLVYPEFE